MRKEYCSVCGRCVGVACKLHFGHITRERESRVILGRVKERDYNCKETFMGIFCREQEEDEYWMV